MDIRTQYQTQYRLDSFHEFNIPKQYHQSKSGIQIFQSKSPKAKGNYITNIEKLAKITPGPGRYSINPESPPPKKKVRKNIDFKKLQQSGTSNYFDKLIKQQSKIPGVGRYETIIDKTELIRQKYKFKGDRDRKKAPIFRDTELGGANKDTLNVSPGKYEVLKPLGYKSTRGSMHPQHRKSASLPKLPSAADYNPIPVSYETFIRKQSMKILGRSDKSPVELKKKGKQSESLGPGPKYSLISNWVITKDKSGRNKGQNFFKSLSTLKTSGIYH